ncbi:MAG: potassium channel protein [Ardenticatenaceae bacterium]|nr:potassium channel protein [Ardenticatenaceae bacterium]
MFQHSQLWFQKAVSRLTLHHHDPMRQLRLSLLVVGLLLAGGTLGYMLLEGLSLVDAIYMTIITLTTVGFGEVRPLSPGGRVFTMGLIILGVSTAAWGLRNAAEVALGAQLWYSMAERQMARQLATIKDHYIVCGFGRMGREVVAELQRRGKPFVVVDQAVETGERLLAAGILHVTGDATHDEVLVRAGIERARGIVAVVNSDADNVMAVLTARGLKPKLVIVARASGDATEKKLLRAGADRVVSPYAAGGLRLALALLRPKVNDLLNTVIYSESLHIEMGELTLGPSSELIGKTLRTSGLRQRWNASVIAIFDARGEVIISPDPGHRLAVGDTLILVAPTESLRQLEND